VDGTIRTLAAGNVLETHRAAILAALVITDELFRTREELRSLRDELERRATLLADLLERAADDGRAIPAASDETPG
jgi:cell division protein ZapA (FtsZ GTPase activity inhibitor)